MNWRARLDAVRGCNFEKRAGDPLTKLTKTPFVGFGSAPDDPFREFEPAVGLDDLRARLAALADAEGYATSLVHRLHADDVAACIGLPDETLRAYLSALHRRAVMDRGMVAPDGYTQLAHCESMRAGVALGRRACARHGLPMVCAPQSGEGHTEAAGDVW